MSDEWMLLVRNPDLSLAGLIEDEVALEATERHLALGAWKVSVPAGSTSADLLLSGAGILLLDGDGQVLLSGPARPTERAADGESDTVTVSGVTDTAALARLCWPRPSQTIPTTGATQDDAHYVTTGPAETVMRTLIDVNAGGSALADRQVSGLVLPASQGRGPTIESKTRFDVLLDALWGIGQTGGIGFRVVQQGASLVWEPYVPVDRSAQVRFSTGLGTLGSYSYSLTPPEVTDIVVGVGGEGQARRFYRFTQPDPLWPDLAREEFIDRRDVDPAATPGSDGYVDPDAAAQASADERFAEAGGKASVTFEPIETDAIRWGRDYWLGDIVTAETEIGDVTDIIREVTYTRTPDEGPRIEPSIGDAQDAPAIYQRVARLRRDVDQLQNRR
ncbi:siphovirus ReqiPepy6 Gp37-like family protein [Nocardiopsis sp. EMB25]|uniref:siphovirus ReqiPepy6 Gp37-like family protein n=1 Tax=Nocardiopsis sp. EMB25 TaxID=2835867 RepID=UPI00228519E8|nr:siphovirus ReqiPepy6 Gp37-like family protein [Nocardiopsis sp. EMB25]MCY9786825.1 siphovirus ReqiPepy6 Gp37-like family protein [Nocardiopsis sp. EMB25]